MCNVCAVVQVFILTRYCHDVREYQVFTMLANHPLQITLLTSLEHFIGSTLYDPLEFCMVYMKKLLCTWYVARKIRTNNGLPYLFKSNMKMAQYIWPYHNIFLTNLRRKRRVYLVHFRQNDTRLSTVTARCTGHIFLFHLHAFFTDFYLSLYID